MLFGERLRELRKEKNLSLRALGAKVGVSFTYISKIENQKLDFADYPSEDLIGKLALALEADVNELMVLAKKIPPDIKEQVLKRPDVFRKLANLDEETLERLMRDIEEEEDEK